MERTIWKHLLRVDDEQEIEIPSDYQVLTIQMQNEIPTIWFLCDADSPKKLVKIACFGTGNPVDWWVKRLNYIGTVQDGMYVWHYFLREVIVQEQ